MAVCGSIYYISGIKYQRENKGYWYSQPLICNFFLYYKSWHSKMTSVMIVKTMGLKLLELLFRHVRFYQEYKIAVFQMDGQWILLVILCLL